MAEGQKDFGVSRLSTQDPNHDEDDGEAGHTGGHRRQRRIALMSFGEQVPGAQI